ncbi:MAG: TerB family tellurite resistance protein [Vicinamibacteraceae bacterium]
MLATILRKLGLEVDVDDATSDVDALDALEAALSNVPPEEARRVAAFAYLLSRVAHADHEVSDAERQAMSRLLVDRARLTAEQADIVIGIATSKIVHVRGTQDYLVSREVAARASVEEKRALIDGLYAVCAADGLISTIEDNDVRRVASEIDLEHHDVVDIRARYRGSLGVLKGE